jgi:hypothetical protein
MTQEPIAPIVHYSYDQSVFRAARNKSWIKGNVIKELAFLRRKGKDLKGLSVSSTPQDATRDLREHFGIIQITVQDIRALGLDVWADSATTNKGNINTALPFYDADDSAEVERAYRLARLLADRANPYIPQESPATH